MWTGEGCVNVSTIEPDGPSLWWQSEKWRHMISAIFVMVKIFEVTREKAEDSCLCAGGGYFNV